MGYKEIQEVDNTHPLTRRIMGTRANELLKIDRQKFIDRYNVIPDELNNYDNYKQDFINQVEESSEVLFNANDDIDTQFDDALSVFYDYIQDDYGTLQRDLRHISIAKLTMKDLYRGYFDALDADKLNNDQLWQIYKSLPKIARRTFFKSSRYQKGRLLEFKPSKSQKDLIRYLRNNEKIKIELEPEQLKSILKKLELGDLINLDKLTATTRTKATDFWTNMSITTYRWSGTVAETVTLARYLPFLTTVNKYAVAPIVLGISLIVATHHHQKFLIKEAKRNKKFIRRCLEKNNKKNELQDMKNDVIRADDFNDKHAYQVIKRWIKKAGLAEEFSRDFREAKKAPLPRQKFNVLKMALANQRDIIAEDDFDTDKESLYKSHLYNFISRTAPEDEYSEESETEIDPPPKRLMIFNKELPWTLQLLWELVTDFFRPFWLLAVKTFGPTFLKIRDICKPYAFPVIFGFVTALGIIALTCAYTLAPEIVVPISIIALTIGAITGIAQYLRDRQHDMRTAILGGQKNKKHNVANQIEDLREYKEDCDTIREIQNTENLKPAPQDHSTDESSEETEIELHVKKGGITKVVTLSKSALAGLKRNTALNFAQYSDSEETETYSSSSEATY